MAILVSVAEQGKVRENMEDYVYPLVKKPTQKEPPFCVGVADGVAGNPFGEWASEMATKLCKTYVDKTINHQVILDEQQLASIFDQIQKDLSYLEIMDISIQGASTTLSVGVFYEDRMLYGYVGDSPVFLIRDNEITEITVPHTTNVWVTIDGNKVLHKSLANCLGGYTGIYKGATTGSIQLQKEDIVIFATDGVTLHLDPEELKDILLEYPLSKAVKVINKTILNRGAYDNFSYVVIVWK